MLNLKGIFLSWSYREKASSFMEDWKIIKKLKIWRLYFCPFFYYLQFPPVAYIRSCAWLLPLRKFELAISKPVNIGKSCIPQKRALLSIVWKKFWNWENFCYRRLQKISVEVVWKSLISTKTCLDPSMAKIHPVS